MKIGVIKEIKDKECRVALTPAGARALLQAGHTVLVQQGAGLGSGFTDMQYREAGAHLVAVDHAWDADLVLKVKEPLASEYPYLQKQLLFTYFHLAGVPKTLTEALLAQQTTAVAYETVEDAQGKLPLLAPMSAIAGNMAIAIGSYYLATFNHGKGMQLGTVLGTPYGKVVIIGAGALCAAPRPPRRRRLTRRSRLWERREHLPGRCDLAARGRSPGPDEPVSAICSDVEGTSRCFAWEGEDDGRPGDAPTISHFRGAE